MHCTDLGKKQESLLPQKFLSRWVQKWNETIHESHNAIGICGGGPHKTAMKNTNHKCGMHSGMKTESFSVRSHCSRCSLDDRSGNAFLTGMVRGTVTLSLAMQEKVPFTKAQYLLLQGLWIICGNHNLWQSPVYCIVQHIVRTCCTCCADVRYCAENRLLAAEERAANLCFGPGLFDFQGQ